jgi:hypothetical protein
MAVSGSLWWSQSNWRNRIVIPISFAPSDDVCASSSSPSADIYGSEILVAATTSWLPAFCRGAKATPIKHVQTGEPQARNLLETSSIEAAFTSRARPDGYSRPVAHAPVAVSGFGIAYSIDDARGDQYSSLKLTQRLLAKLLTQSYPAIPAVKSGYAGLSGNPLDISLDPEFIALNPGIRKGVYAGVTAATIYSISSDSDVMYALTAYLAADPETRQWLDGAPDPWGMKVNPSYLKIALPVDSWPQLDTFEPTSLYETGSNACLKDAPVPFLPLVASPTSRLASIAQAMQYSLAQSQVVCVQPFPGTSVGQKLTGLGRQSSGFRFMLGITSLADAARFGLDTAALMTNVTSGAGSAFVSAGGRGFVAPTPTSLRAAAALLATGSSVVDWQLPYATIASDPRGARAYPGTMVVYADVPTSGLVARDAAAYARFLTYASSVGQRPGPRQGQLPDGYLPMTKANGLERLAGYTARSAEYVRAQKGGTPPLVAPAPDPTPDPTPSPTTGTGTGSHAGSGSPVTPGSGTSATPAPHASAAPTAVAVAPVALRTPAVAAGPLGLALPLLLLVAAAAAAAAGVTLVFSREES